MSYEKKTWENGSELTPDDLNKYEDTLEEHEEKIEKYEDTLEEHEEKIEEKLDATTRAYTELGKAVFNLLLNDYSPGAGVIASIDTVGEHIVIDNSEELPRVWGNNIVMIKDFDGDAVVGVGNTATTSSVIGSEISVTNNTNNAGTPLSANQLVGLFLSYIHTQNKASAAIATGGFSAGWMEGIHIDGIDKDDGRAIVINDDVSGNQGMGIGIDMRLVSAFKSAAIRLGIGHQIAVYGADGGTHALFGVNDSGHLTIGGYTGATGYTIVKAGTSTLILFQNASGSASKICMDTANGRLGIGTEGMYGAGNPLHIKSGNEVAIKLEGAGNTTTSATAGSAGSLPAQPVGYLNVNIDGTVRKIPYYA